LIDIFVRADRRSVPHDPKKQAGEYVRRWRLLEKMRIAEPRRLSLKEKLQQMDACYQMAVGLGLNRKMTALKRQGEKEVRCRWRRLKNIAP
jgi:hypothetical protein